MSPVAERAVPRFTDGAERHPIITHTHRTLLSYLPPDARRVVEAGCGEGRVLEAMRRRGVTELVGVDLVPHPRRWRGVDAPPGLVKGDMGRLPLPSGSFDAAVCLFVFPPNGGTARTDGVRELARVVRPGGTLIFCMHNIFNPLLLARRIFFRLTYVYEEHAPIQSPRGVEQRLAAAGFRIRHRLGISVPPYVRTRGLEGRAARLYYRWFSSRPLTAPIIGLVAERRV